MLKSSHKNSLKRAGIAGGIASLGAFALIVGSASAAHAASSLEIDFDAAGYDIAVAAAPAGQNGWTKGSNIPGNWGLVDAATYPLSGLTGTALRFANLTADLNIAQLSSPAIDAVGEPGVAGATTNQFDLTFTVASANGAAQPGLDVDIALGGAARYGGVVNLYSTAAGIQVGSYWVPEGATSVGSVSDWRSAVFTTMDPTVPHDVRIVATFIADAADTLDVYVDGALVSAGSGATTWEFYHAVVTPANPKRTIDSISFKTSASAASGPATGGVGYTSSLPVAPAGTPGYLFGGISYAADEHDAGDLDVNVVITEVPEPGVLAMTVGGTSTTLSENGSTATIRQFTGTLPTVTVTDTRVFPERIDPAAHWHVLGTAGAFSGTATQPDITVNHLGWTPALTAGTDATEVAAGAQVGTVLDSGPGAVGLVDQELLVTTSPSRDLAAGSWSANAALFLKTPITVAPGSYTSTLTLSLFEYAG